MRVLMLSKALVVGAYQRKLEEIATQADIDLTVVVPPEWRDERGVLKLERAYTNGYRLVVTPIRFNGNFHLHYYPHIGKIMAETKPEIVHIDEEPYNLATWHALRAARRHHAKTLFFSWQNLLRNYPFPFSTFEADVLKHSDYGICGNNDAVQVWRTKGYRGPLTVIPQFGIDPDISTVTTAQLERPFTICYAGRFVPEKGVEVLIRACAKLSDNFKLILVGSGPTRAGLEQLVNELDLRERVTFCPWMPSTEFPNFLRSVDTLVLPSISQPNWKEQFGRVLIEAMACGVNVIGSTCGEIPNLIGEAGLVFPEKDVEALTAALQRLQGDPGLRADLRRKGRERVLAHFTQRRVAEATVKVYREMLGSETKI